MDDQRTDRDGGVRAKRRRILTLGCDYCRADISSKLCLPFVFYSVLIAMAEEAIFGTASISKFSIIRSEFFFLAAGGNTRHDMPSMDFW